MLTNHFNQLTEAESERLAILMEECAEVIAICGKILRHGYQSQNPNDPDAGRNSEQLERELGDVLWATRRMEFSGDVSWRSINQFAATKAIKAHPYLHHQEPPDAD